MQLKFTAPEKPGTYQYTVVVRSDSYVDFDSHKYFKVSEGSVREFSLASHHLHGQS